MTIDAMTAVDIGGGESTRHGNRSTTAGCQRQVGLGGGTQQNQSVCRVSMAGPNQQRRRFAVHGTSDKQLTSIPTFVEY